MTASKLLVPPYTFMGYTGENYLYFALSRANFLSANQFVPSRCSYYNCSKLRKRTYNDGVNSEVKKRTLNVVQIYHRTPNGD